MWRRLVERLSWRRRFEAKLDLLVAVVTDTRRVVMASNEEILDEVRQQTTVADGILALVQRLVNENDPVKRQEILDTLKANRATFEAAVLAGTPQQP